MLRKRCFTPGQLQTRGRLARPAIRPLGRLAVLAPAAIALLMSAATVLAQDEKKDLPPRQEISLRTKDGVQLAASYYPGTKGKEAVPIIMLHGDGGNRHDFETLAAFIQEKGHAVVVPDLRGHGDSTTVIGMDRKLTAETMPPGQYNRMWQFDVEAIKKFLLEEHNAGRLNIDKLCLVGAEMGSIVAMNWAVLDWSWPPLATGKQGQDVKAIVLISPQDHHKALRMAKALAHQAVKKEISFYIAMGASDAKALKESTQIHDAVNRFRKPPKELKEKTVFLDETLDTNLQGTRLLGEPALGLEDNIARFIELRLEQQPFPWKERKSPL